MNAVAKAMPKRMAERVDALDWERVSQDLDAQGSAVVERLLSPDECQAHTPAPMCARGRKR